MNLLAHVDAAGWWGPAGWAYRNLPGNITADIVLGCAAYYAGFRRALKRLHEKLDRHHEAVCAIHEHLGIQEATHD